MAELFEAGEILIDFSWTSKEELERFCPSTLGCADGTAAFSRFALDEHESFHASHGGTAHRGLEEGLAVAFGDDRELPGDVAGSIEAMLREAGQFDLPKASSYPRLGHFVSFLRADFGNEALVHLAQRSSITDSYDDLADDVASSLGMDLPDVISEYESDYPICDPWRYRYDGFDCGGDGIDLPSVDGEEVVENVRVACEDEATLGPRAGEIWRTIPLRVASDGRFKIDVVPEAGAAHVRLDECGVSCFDADSAFYFEFEDGVLVGLEPCLGIGTYLMRVAVDADESVDVTLKATRLDSQACD